MASPRKTQVVVSLPSSTNATNVRTLVRTDYKLPQEATKILKQFFELEEGSKIEVVTVEKENSPLVFLRVTTDDKTQNSIAQFLSAVYPQKKIDQIEASFKKTQAAKVKEEEVAFASGDEPEEKAEDFEDVDQ